MAQRVASWGPRLFNNKSSTWKSWATGGMLPGGVMQLASFYAPLTDAGNGVVNTNLGRGLGSATFSRANPIATTYNRSGIIIPVGANLPRSYYDPTTLDFEGYLDEPQRTNLILWSEDFSNAAWGKIDTTVTANATVAPDGAVTADLLTQGAAGTAQTRPAVALVGTANGFYSISSFAKYSNAAWILQTIDDGLGNSFQSWYNIQTGVLGQSAATGTGTSVNAFIQQCPNGWYRLKIVGKVNNASTAITPRYLAVDGDGLSTRATPNMAFYCWGAQFEDADVVTTYIPTGAAAVVRTVDSGLSYPPGGNISFTEGSVLVTGRLHGILQTPTIQYFFSSGAGGQVMYHFNTAPNKIDIFDGTSVASSAAGSVITGPQKKFMVTWGPAGLSATKEGLAPNTVAFDGLMLGNGIIIGAGPAGATACIGTTKEVWVWPNQLPPSYQQGATA